GCRGTRKPGLVSSWGLRPAQSRWQPEFLSYLALRTFKLCSSSATNSCRRSVCRSSFPRLRYLLRSHTQVKFVARSRDHLCSRLAARSRAWFWGKWCVAVCGRKSSGCGFSLGYCCSAPIWRYTTSCDRLSASERRHQDSCDENRRSFPRYERPYARLGRLRRQQDVLRAEPANRPNRCAAHRHGPARGHPFVRRYACDRQQQG